MTQDQMTNLFTNYTKIINNRELNREGVGLGLTISKNLAKALGGDIFATSSIGIGSSFTLKIPAQFVKLQSDFAEGLEKEQVDTKSLVKFDETSFHEEIQ